MEDKKKSNVLLKNGVIKVHSHRDTVLIRIDRNLRESLRELSRETKTTMSKIVDFAVSIYLKSVKRIKGRNSIN